MGLDRQDYWESKVYFSDIYVHSKNKDNKLIKTIYYAKLEPSPVENDMSCLELDIIDYKRSKNWYD